MKGINFITRDSESVDIGTSKFCILKSGKSSPKTLSSTSEAIKSPMKSSSRDSVLCPFSIPEWFSMYSRSPSSNSNCSQYLYMLFQLKYIFSFFKSVRHNIRTASFLSEAKSPQQERISSKHTVSCDSTISYNIALSIVLYSKSATSFSKSFIEPCAIIPLTNSGIWLLIFCRIESHANSLREE